jgi:prepilin-type N-terminal cleavage/methylation domain-containing protein
VNAPLFRASHDNRGMVLLEVIIALTIFAVVSLGLVLALNESFSAAQDRNAADAVARGLRNQLVLLRAAPLAPGDRDLPDDGSGTTYHLDIAPEPMLDQKKQPVLGLYRATINAQWKRDGHAEKQEISELLYQP